MEARRHVTALRSGTLWCPLDAQARARERVRYCLRIVDKNYHAHSPVTIKPVGGRLPPRLRSRSRLDVSIGTTRLTLTTILSGSPSFWGATMVVPRCRCSTVPSPYSSARVDEVSECTHHHPCVMRSDLSRGRVQGKNNTFS